MDCRRPKLRTEFLFDQVDTHIGLRQKGRQSLMCSCNLPVRVVLEALVSFAGAEEENQGRDEFKLASGMT
jgi:hypothetical protein